MTEFSWINVGLLDSIWETIFHRSRWFVGELNNYKIFKQDLASWRYSLCYGAFSNPCIVLWLVTEDRVTCVWITMPHRQWSLGRGREAEDAVEIWSSCADETCWRTWTSLYLHKRSLRIEMLFIKRMEVSLPYLYCFSVQHGSSAWLKSSWC